MSKFGVLLLEYIQSTAHKRCSDLFSKVQNASFDTETLYLVLNKFNHLNVIKKQTHSTF